MGRVPRVVVGGGGGGDRRGGRETDQGQGGGAQEGASCSVHAGTRSRHRDRVPLVRTAPTQEHATGAHSVHYAGAEMRGSGGEWWPSGHLRTGAGAQMSRRAAEVRRAVTGGQAASSSSQPRHQRGRREPAKGGPCS